MSVSQANWIVVSPWLTRRLAASKPGRSSPPPRQRNAVPTGQDLPDLGRPRVHPGRAVRLHGADVLDRADEGLGKIAPHETLDRQGGESVRAGPCEGDHQLGIRSEVTTPSRALTKPACEPHPSSAIGGRSRLCAAGISFSDVPGSASRPPQDQTGTAAARSRHSSARRTAQGCPATARWQGPPQSRQGEA